MAQVKTLTVFSLENKQIIYVKYDVSIIDRTVSHDSVINDYSILIEADQNYVITMAAIKDIEAHIKYEALHIYLESKIKAIESMVD